MANVPRGGSDSWRDLAAFLAVLVTGILLIIFGHLTASSLATVCAALVGVYAAWRHHRS
jgi:hypothetical protein